MAYKTGGYKTRYIESYSSYFYHEYTIYCAVESTSDICVYKMFDEDDKEHDICIGAEDDTDAVGKYSLIDCLYQLKQHEDKHYKYIEYDIIIEEMTPEEVMKYFK